MKCFDLLSAADQAVREVVLRVAKLELTPAEEAAVGKCCSLQADVQGEYRLVLVLEATPEFMQAACENMRHGRPADWEEVPAYMVELFNMLCGRMVSALNHHTKQSARFAIPFYREQPYAGRPGERVQTLYYQSGYGPVRMRTICPGPGAS